MGVAHKVILGDTSDQGPALASHAGGLVLAWKGFGNDYLNVMVSTDDGKSFVTGHKRTFADASDQAPALTSHNGRLFMAWKGSGNDNLNVAELVPAALAGSTPIAYDLKNKITLSDRSDQGPALESHAGGLVLAWKGSGNDYLNVMVSTDDGRSFLAGHRRTFTDASDRAPALVSHDGLHLAWKGSGNENLNVAKLVPAALAGSTPVAYELADKLTLGDTSEQGPALAGSLNLQLSWKGAGNDNLNIIRFGLGSYNVEHKITFDEFSDHGPALTGHKLYLLMGWKGSGNENLNVALVYP